MSRYRVRLYNDWRYYKAGEIISVNRIVANALIEQNIGCYDKPKKPEGKKLDNKKEIKEAPKDKMVKGASKTK